MGAWIASVPALVVALSVLFGPGLLAGIGLRLRGLMLWALAPVVSTAIIGLSAIVYGELGVPWSTFTVAAACLAVVLLAWTVRFLPAPQRTAPASRRGSVLLVAGLAVGVVAGVARFALYVGNPQAISQTNDAMFHLNAVRWIIETADASSLHVAAMVGGSGVYPAAWHGLDSLVAMASGADISTSANMLSLAVAFGAWPLGIAWLTMVATRSRLTAALAAAQSSMLLVFPLLMLEWGVLYPYGLSLALLPAAVGVVIATVRWVGGAGPLAGRLGNAVLGSALVLVAAGAIALAQPSTLLAWGLLTLIWLTWRAAARARVARGARRAVVVAVPAALWVAFVVLWIGLTRMTTGSHWEPFTGEAQAVLDVLVNGHMWLPPAVGVSILCAVGLVAAARHRSLRWLATGWLVFAALYVAAASVDHDFVRRWVVGAWYADPYRLAALAPVTVVPLAAIGLSEIVRWASRTLSRRRDPEPVGTAWAITAIAAVAAVGTALVPVLTMPNVFEDEWDAQSRYESNPRSFLSPDERLLLERMATTVPTDATIIANPSTGAAFGYVLSGRNVYPRTWQAPSGDAWAVLAAGLNKAATDPAVCAALAELGSPGYVIDFGPGEASPGRYVMPGMSGFEGRPGFEKVDQRGEASLWRITACAP